MTSAPRPERRFARMYAWIAEHRETINWIQALVFFVFAAWEAGAQPSVWDVIGYATGTAVIGLRASHPGWTLTAAWACAAAQLASLHTVSAPTVFAVLVAVSAVARRGSTPIQRWLAVSVPVGAILAGLYLSASEGSGGTVVFPPQAFQPSAVLTSATVTAITLTAAWLLGRLGRMRDNYRVQAVETTLARAAEHSARQRADLARDMHDVLAHSLSVTVALADGARLSQPDLPEETARALKDISTVCRSALADVRTLLTRLRAADDLATGDTLSATIDGTVADLRGAGLAVDLVESGTPPDESDATRRTVAHLLREALTNALRHGDTSQPALVRIDWTDPVHLTVRNALDTTTHDAPVPAGHWGVRGMRERVSLVGGTMVCGPEGNSWVLDVSLPGQEIA